MMLCNLRGEKQAAPATENSVARCIDIIRLLPRVAIEFHNLANQTMATLQSLSPAFRPSIPAPNSHAFPAATPFNSSPKFVGSKGLSISLRHSIISTRVSNFEYSPQIAETLGDVSIFTASGEPVRFSDLWDQNQALWMPVLVTDLTFSHQLRHIYVIVLLIYALWNLVISWELASALKESKERFDSAGVKLIAVGIGSPNKARMLANRLPFPMDCLYADPDRKAYDVLNLYYGFGRTFFNPASAKVFSRFHALQKAVKNYTIEATPDDRSGVLQQGGMFVFGGKELLYARKDEGTGDHAPLDDVFNVCCKAPVA
ncbi:hypothetical protein V8G54_001559 [Vigna mungo]|uniref:Thioredoxin-like protein AAED1, chloroplastic n=1 Tax=Vigna mungo TaxID=3915 RepID=A0AAQ3P8I5_VIGMU